MESKAQIKYHEYLGGAIIPLQDLKMLLYRVRVLWECVFAM